MKDNGDTVTVRFYSGKDHPIYVTVKKTVPRRVNSNNEEKDIFARGALWVQMLEKAYVASGLAMQMKKWTGPDASMKSRDEDEFSTIALALQKQGKVHYETIGGGDSSSFMFFLTGKKGKHGNFVTSYSSPNKQFEKGVYDIPADDHSFWNMVLNKEQGKGKVITVSTKSDYMMVDEEKGLNNEKMFRGLATNHSYTVLGIERIDGEERILLRNPWGTGTAEEVYNEVTGSIGIRKSEDPTDGGVFTLSKVQFFSMFDGYHIGRIPGEGIKKGSGK